MYSRFLLTVLLDLVLTFSTYTFLVNTYYRSVKRNTNLEDHTCIYFSKFGIRFI